jgi:hypothetical protein
MSTSLRALKGPSHTPVSSTHPCRLLHPPDAAAQSEHPADFAHAAGNEIEIMRTLLVKPDYAKLVIAVSLGSVFFGAMTSIRNGPNFMVKSIADSANVKAPSFVGYVFTSSLPILCPILALGGWLFL